MKALLILIVWIFFNVDWRGSLYLSNALSTGHKSNPPQPTTSH
jgi:hypothetical protein